MATQALNMTVDNADALVSYVGSIGLWIQGVGLFIILWIVFQTISLVWNAKKRRTLSYLKDDIVFLKQDVKRVEEKVDRILEGGGDKKW